MKKLIAILLIAVMVMSFAACGTVNKTEVSVLWSGDGIVKVPNSLINAMDRAMYSENISYKHYGAKGDQAAQTKQAQDSLNAGCAALAVELVDASAAQAIVDAAKAKNVPVVFFNCEVDAAVISSYEKCVCVSSNTATVADIQSEMIAETLIVEKKGIFDFITGKKPTYHIFEDWDRNKDGKISYLPVGNVSATVTAINAKLTEKELPALVAAAETADVATITALTESKYVNADGDDFALLNTANGTSVELILVVDDVTALDVLVALQKHGFNSNKLKTHFIPTYTVGNDADYKAYVMNTMPASPADLTTKDDAEIKLLKDWWKSNKDVEAWKAANTNLCNMYSVDWSDLNEFLYTTSDVIGAGRLSGAAIEDQDTIATTVAAVLCNLLKNKATFDGVDEEWVSGNTVKIPYTTKVAG